MPRTLRLLPLALLLATAGRAGEAPFLMAVEDVFTITGRGTVITGKVERGSIQVGQPLELIGLGKDARTEVVSLESFRKLLTKAETGQNCGILVRNLGRDQVLRGQVLAAPGSLQAHSDFSANIHWIPKEKGGRSTPITADYHPYCQFRTASVSGDWVDLPTSIAPASETNLKVHLQQPVAMEKGQIFTITMASRPVAEGTVSEIR